MVCCTLCELGVVSQGKTIEEAQGKLKEAVELFLHTLWHSQANRLVKRRSPARSQVNATRQLPDRVCVLV